MNRYTIEKQVGLGTFGEVSRAVQNSTGEVVAVKRMRQRFGSWEECLQLREIISLRRLQHPCIIKLKEVVRENTELFLIFEYMDLNIYQITRQRSEALNSSSNGTGNIFTDKEVRSIMAQTLLGLQAVHKGGFMHRDLKPENLLTKGDSVKIADFGLAKEIRSRPPFTDYVSTRWYRAPEICLRSTNYNSPIDIWACGVIFAELYLNRPLFPGASDADQIFKMCSVLGAPTPQDWEEGHVLARRLNIRFPSISPTPLRTLLSNAPPAAIDLLEQMLRYNPQDRPTSTQCLQHPFFTGATASGASGGGVGAGGGGDGMSISASMFQGISSGQPHNPFHIAVGVPASGGVGGLPGLGQPVGGMSGPLGSSGSRGSGDGPASSNAVGGAQQLYGGGGNRYSPQGGNTPIPSPGPGGAAFVGGPPPGGGGYGVVPGPHPGGANSLMQQQGGPSGFGGTYGGGGRAPSVAGGTGAAVVGGGYGGGNTMQQQSPFGTQPPQPAWDRGPQQQQQGGYGQHNNQSAYPPPHHSTTTSFGGGGGGIGGSGYPSHHMGGNNAAAAPPAYANDPLLGPTGPYGGAFFGGGMHHSSAYPVQQQPPVQQPASTYQPYGQQQQPPRTNTLAGGATGFGQGSTGGGYSGGHSSTATTGAPQQPSGVGTRLPAALWTTDDDLLQY